MTRRVSLEDFDGLPEPAPQPPETEPAPQIDLDAIRSAAYEDGYKNGWDDCHAENVKSEQAVSSNLAQNLKEVSLTYREARSDVLTAIRPVIDTIIEQLLPKIADDGLGALVAGELMPLIKEAGSLEPELVGAPAIVPMLQKLVDQFDDPAVRVRPDPGLSSAQVALRLGAEAREIDLSKAIAEIGAELDRFTTRLIAETASDQQQETPGE